MVYWELKIAQMYRIAFLLSSVFILILWSSCQQKKAIETPASLPFYNTADFTPQFINNKSEVSQKITHQISDFSFTDQNGKTISLNTVEGKVHVADFIFTSCGSICPEMTDHMKIIADAYQQNPNVVLLSFSVTPWIDDVQNLKNYTLVKKINNPNWHFLTGDKNEIYDLARKSYFAEEDLGFSKDSTEFLHTEHMLLIDKHQRIRGIYNGTLTLEVEQMVKDIRLLLQED